MNTTGKNNRYTEIDMVRFLGILLVLIGHSDIFPQVDHGGEWFIALFHVAVFYIAAGFVYKDKYHDSFHSVLLYFFQRIRGLWLPFVFVNLFMEIVCGITSGFKSIEIRHLLRIVLMFENSRYVGASWFIIAIFYISLLFVFVSYTLKRFCGSLRTRETIHFMISFSMLMLGFTFRNYLSMQLLWVLYGYIMFYFGRKIRQIVNKIQSLCCREMRRIDRKQLRFALCVGCLSSCIVATIILYLCKNWRTLSLATNQIVNPIYYIVVSLIGWILLYSISIILMKILPKRIISVLLLFGQSSLFILLLHLEIWIYVVDPIIGSFFAEVDLFTKTLEIVYKSVKITIGIVVPSLIYLAYKPIDRRVKSFIYQNMNRI